jgi:predicted DNA-binding transcriptional regulator AlpA
MTHQDRLGTRMETMTLDEVSQILKISEHTARNRLSQGLAMPPSFRVGRRRLFLTSEVQRWIAEQSEKRPKAMPKD